MLGRDLEVQPGEATAVLSRSPGGAYSRAGGTPPCVQHVQWVPSVSLAGGLVPRRQCDNTELCPSSLGSSVSWETSS